MTRAPFIKKRIELKIQTQGVATTPTQATLRWIETSGGILDEVTGAMTGEDQTAMESGVAALVHTVGASSAVRNWAEIQAGDLLMDVVADVDFSALPNLRIEVGGVLYDPQQVPNGLNEIWDVQFAGLKFSRTILLKRAT